MMEREIEYDVNGTELLTVAIKDLLNSYPDLGGEEVTFATLSESGGMAMYPTQGAVVQSKRESITGHISMKCLYPFTIIVRANGLTESRKQLTKEDLENLGKWLERQPVLIDGTVYQLTEYPALTGGREIKSIARTTPAYLNQIRENMAEDWAIAIQVVYTTDYDI